MPGFTSYDHMIGIITQSGNYTSDDFFKYGSASQAAGSWHSLWHSDGLPSSGGLAAGTTGVAYVSLASGGLVYSDVSPAQRYLTSFGAAGTTSCVLMLYERLVGVNSTLVTVGPKTINSATLPRYASGTDVQCWLEVTTATATTAPVCRISGYTNEAGVTGRVGPTTTFPAAITVRGCMIPMPLAAGDVGVQYVASLQIVTAPSAGAVNLLLLRPLAYLPVVANNWNEKDFVLQVPALPRIYDGATLALAYLGSAVTATNFWGVVRTAYA